MPKRVLITGGGGFIGSHLADELLTRGYQVRALDNLLPQVHGPDAARPAYLHRDVEWIKGDVRDANAVARALHNIDAVYHLAALVGVGQSMYEIAEYTDVNNRGTAVLLEALIKSPVERLVVASSMSLYGEGLYRTSGGQAVMGQERPLGQLKRHEWETRDADGQALSPLPTPESKTPCLSSVYALSKYDQERLCLITGRAYNIPTVALRFFNVFGTRQAHMQADDDHQADRVAVGATLRKGIVHAKSSRSGHGERCSRWPGLRINAHLDRPETRVSSR